VEEMLSQVHCGLSKWRLGEQIMEETEVGRQVHGLGNKEGEEEKEWMRWTKHVLSV
jgi:hypothetical protein